MNDEDDQSGQVTSRHVAPAVGFGLTRKSNQLTEYFRLQPTKKFQYTARTTIQTFLRKTFVVFLSYINFLLSRVKVKSTERLDFANQLVLDSTGYGRLYRSWLIVSKGIRDGDPPRVPSSSFFASGPVETPPPPSYNTKNP